MNRILNAIKCAICHEILESPVILPCSCNICYKHVKNQNKDFIQCEKCGVEHQIPTNGFHANKGLQVIIEAEIQMSISIKIRCKYIRFACLFINNNISRCKTP